MAKQNVNNKSISQKRARFNVLAFSCLICFEAHYRYYLINKNTKQSLSMFKPNLLNIVIHFVIAYLIVSNLIFFPSQFQNYSHIMLNVECRESDHDQRRQIPRQTKNNKNTFEMDSIRRARLIEDFNQFIARWHFRHAHCLLAAVFV